MRNYKVKDVDTFIADSAPEARPHLKKLREIIRSTVPKAEEKISWGVPFYWYKGALAGIVGLKNHVDFGLIFRLEAKDREVLKAKGYETGSKTVKIRFDQKIPSTIIKRILKAQAKVNEAKKAEKS